MYLESLLLLVLNFAFIGALPRVFFRKGEFHLTWLLTALPLFAAPVIVALIYFDVLGNYDPTEWEAWLRLAAVVLNAASIALIGLTIGTNRVPLSLWHQKDDAPQNIVTFGSYRYIRHPFYSSFLLALVAAFLAAPHWLTLLTLIGGFAILNVTAAGEEKRLSASAFGEEYRQYMTRTGRFLPRWTQRDA